MQLRIVHTTGFEYDGLALASYNQARMTPQTGPGQIVVHTRLDVSPTPWTYDYRDYFGNEVTSFEVLDPHESMTVTAVVDGAHRPAAGVAAGTRLGGPRRRPRSPTGGPSTSRSRRSSRRRTTWPRSCATSPTRPARPERPRATSARWSTPRWTTGPARPTSPPRPSTPGRSAPGVCQDMAHLVLGGLRTIGIPARYVSGYLHPQADAPDRRDRRRASRTRGSSGGTTAGTASTRPTTSSPATAGSWSRPAATTSTYAPSTASTPAPDVLDVRPGRRHPDRLNAPARRLGLLDEWVGRAAAVRPRTARVEGRGRSGLHRAGWWPTATRGNPRDSATENRPPLLRATARRSGKGETVVQETTSAPGDRRS